MSTRSDLSGVHAKLERAEEHIEALRQATEAFEGADPAPFGIRHEAEPGPNGCITYQLFAVVREAPPSRLGLIVGDVLQNVRAALDHLVFQFASPEARSKNSTQFPICDNAKAFQGHRVQGQIAGVTDVARLFIERAQPYQRTMDQGHPLVFLREFSNQDKHRLLVPSIAGVSELDTWMSCDNADIQITSFPGGSVCDGDVVLSFIATPRAATREMTVSPRSQLHVQIRDPAITQAPLPGMHIVDFARMIHFHVSWMIRSWDEHGWFPPTDAQPVLQVGQATPDQQDGGG